MEKERRKDDNFVVIDRKIPTTWLFTILFAIVSWGISTYYNTQRNIEALQKNMDIVTAAVSKLSDRVSDKEISDARNSVQVKEFDRRIERLEKEK